MSQFSSPFTERYISLCTSCGSEEDMPCTYTSSVSAPSGSRKSWCLSLSEKRTTLVSIEGQ